MIRGSELGYPGFCEAHSSSLDELKITTWSRIISSAHRLTMPLQKTTPPSAREPVLVRGPFGKVTGSPWPFEIDDLVCTATI